jgi:hypothetical protein
MHQKIDFSNLVPKLPPLISRDHIEKILGGVISSKTLANLDSLVVTGWDLTRQIMCGWDNNTICDQNQ